MCTSEQIHVQVDSPDMEIPSPVLKAHLDPVKVVVDPGRLASGVLNLLNIDEKGLKDGQPIQVRDQSPIIFLS